MTQPDTKEVKFSNVDVEARRQSVGAWISNNLRPAAKVLDEAAEQDRKASSFEVREYQLDAWGSLWDARQQGQERGLVHLATGLGKTSVAVFDVMKFREEQLAQDPPTIPRVLFVSHMTDISDQARERFEHFMPDLEMDNFDTDQPNRPDVDIRFATFQSLHSKLDQLDPQDYEYIIYDEAHHTEAPTFKAVRDYFDPLFELAITATPDRMDKKDIRDYFGEAVYSKSLPEGIGEGWLADVDYHIVFDDIVKKIMEEGFEPGTLKELNDLFNVEPRNEVIANNIREEQQRIGVEQAKTVIFCKNIEHAEAMAELLDGVSYHSGLEQEDRKQILQGFRNGNHKVICTVDMFNEGIDVPDASVIVFLRSTQSGNIFEQQLGRGLRKTKGKDKVTVLDFVANIERIIKVRELSQKIQGSRGGDEGIDEGDYTSNDALDDDATIICGGEVKDGEGGLQVRMQHGNFDFNSIAVNLLEKYNQFTIKDIFKFSDYTNDQLIELATQLSPGKPISKTAMEELSKKRLFPSARTIQDRFGSTREFHVACGYEPTGFRDFTADEIVELARSVSPNKPLTQRMIIDMSKEGLFPGTSIIYDRFKSVKAFQEACGFTTGSRFKDYTADDIIKLAKEISPDRVIHQGDITRLSKDGSFVSRERIVKVFGSVTAFREACGNEQVNFTGITADEIVELANKLSPDKPLTKSMIDELSKKRVFPSVNVVMDRFSSMENFQAQRGLDSERQRSLRRSELIALALELSPDKPIARRTMDAVLSKQNIFPSSTTIRDLFGSIKEFQRECGFE